MPKPRRAICIYMMKKALFMLAMLTCIFASCSDGGSEDPVTPTPKPEEVKTEETKTDNGYKELLEVVNSLKETVKAMQADNAKKASGEPPHKETAESAIRSFFEDTPKN